jgi:hypothetical protein
MSQAEREQEKERAATRRRAFYVNLCRELPTKLRSDVATAVQKFAEQLEKDREVFAKTPGHERIAEEYIPRIETLKEFALQIEP